MDVLEQKTLEVDGPTFVEPEVGPVGTRGEVARPRMAELVQQDVSQASVTADKGGGQRCQVGVLHASVGKEGGRTTES